MFVMVEGLGFRDHGLEVWIVALNVHFRTWLRWIQDRDLESARP